MKNQTSEKEQVIKIGDIEYPLFRMTFTPIVPEIINLAYTLGYEAALNGVPKNHEEMMADVYAELPNLPSCSLPLK